MPKFSEKELIAVKKILHQKGKELFIEYGLKKTSIDDIVQACDIAKGSFYKFFSSKEELYFDILKSEEEDYLKIYNSIIDSKENGADLISTLIKNLWLFHSSNAFLQLFYERNEVQNLIRKIPQEEIQHYTEAQRQKFINSVGNLQTDGRIKSIKPEIIEGLVRGALLLTLQKRRIGEHLFEDVMNYIIEFIGIGLEAKETTYENGELLI
ncbi:TetR/AcrR family transcriptional regulator [Neobacillus sp. PS3-34]|uniref:TetR/AcrR family transcriptional regulator n=1 Tax=Neobacillus sp. PS3-34 TaxID=3070678 RepID=UPI0027DF4FD6|nr:TetR/AcrR family transcriptional regulator [Neobacillus sp. PS3-34]WML49804.1 TetR/AcrR family transcriptional regulator [Neobacillus sp. PS3-34]